MSVNVLQPFSKDNVSVRVIQLMSKNIAAASVLELFLKDSVSVCGFFVKGKCLRMCLRILQLEAKSFPSFHCSFFLTVCVF